jgi:hypothetical protein
MTTRKKDIREKIFEIFSNNLRIIRTNSAISFEPDFTDGYLCPICFEPYFINDLDTNLPNFLTIEDVPPKKLGGNAKLLTCKKCNSLCGHSLDIHLKQLLEYADARELLPNSSYRTSFKSQSARMNGNVEIDKDRKFIIRLNNKCSNPKESNQFMKEVFPPRVLHNPMFYLDKPPEPYRTGNVTLQLPEVLNKRNAEIALLKTAYLLAFSILGNAFLINGPLYKVREQILNPEKKLLRNVFWINNDYPDSMIGINLVKKPKELRCFLIVLYLSTKSKRRQFAIALPGPSVPGIKIYENIENILCSGSGESTIDLEIEHIDDDNFVSEPDKAWASLWYWQKYCQD